MNNKIEFPESFYDWMQIQPQKIRLKHTQIKGFNRLHVFYTD